MAILVTGGAGFVGSHLVERLVSSGEEIVCVDNFADYYDPYIKRQNIGHLMEHRSFHLEEADILDLARMKAVFANYEVSEIVHLAARAGVRPSLQDPVLYEQVNVRGTLNLLELARTSGVRRFILTSSSSVYGERTAVPFREDDAADRPISPYAATKRAAELACHTYHHLYGLSVTCLRLFTVYGPRQRPDLAIHSFVRAIHEGREVMLFGDGTSARDYTFVDDVVEAFVAALRVEPPLAYEIVNVGHGSPVSLRRVIDLLEHELGQPAHIRQQPSQPGDVSLTFADVEKAWRLLGWRPQVSIEEGIRQFVVWFLQGARDVVPVQSAPARSGGRLD